MKKYSFSSVVAAKGRFQSWTNRLILEPIFDRLTYITANYTTLTANQLSILGILFGLASAYFFATTHFLLGGVLFEVANLFDTLDGRIARLKKHGSFFGNYLDDYGGFWVIFLCIFGFTLGLFSKTSNPLYLVGGFFLFFLMIAHFTEGTIVGNILGGQKEYKKSVFRVSRSGGLVNRFKSWLVKQRWREPANLTDMEHVIFTLTPIVGVILGFWMIKYMLALAGLLLLANVLFWMWNYRQLLTNIDKKRRR